MVFKCVIPAAGFGTRLGDLTKDNPKAFLSFGETTLLENLIDKLEEIQDIDEICVVTNDKFHGFFEEWIKREGKTKIKLLSNGVREEKDKKGAIKDTLYGIEKMGWQASDVLIMGSDNFFNASLISAAEEFMNSKYSLAVMCDYKSPEKAKKLAVATLGENNEILEIEEKPLLPKTTLGCPLIYFIKSQDINKLRELALTEKDNIGHLLEKIQKERGLKGFLLNEEIVDVGTLEDYEKVGKRFQD